MTNDVVERLLTDFYVSKAYDPRAERPADTVKAAIAFTIEALAVREGWQDIASAPKDGTQIDLWVVFENESGARWAVRWADASWQEAGKHNCAGQANWTSRNGWPLHGLMGKPVATHWRPLPLGPST